MKLKFFVEGAADMKFLTDFISIRFGKKVTKQDFVILDGWTNIKKEIPAFKRNFEDSGYNILILDADESKNEGGFDRRKDEIATLKELEKIEFDLFLFPNNKNDGDLEVLLSNIINEDNKEILNCWDGFENCINSLKKNYTIPARKTKIYAYMEVIHGSSNKEKEKIKDRNRDFTNTEHWNLHDEFLNSLYSFLKPFLVSAEFPSYP